jgi:hypothetical protein
MTRRAALHEASRAAFQNDVAPRVWEQRLSRRQGVIRGLYLAQAKLLQASGDGGDRALGREVEAFVKAMPQPDSQRLALARGLRAAARSPDRRADEQTRDRRR